MHLLKNTVCNNEYQNYLNLKLNKQSIQSNNSLNHRQSIEDMLQYQKILKGSQQSQPGKTKKTESESKSTNLSQIKTEYSSASNQQFLKQKSKEETTSYDPNKQILIILYYKQQKYTYSYEFKNQTTDNLYNYLIQQIACIERSFTKLGSGTGSTEGDQIQQELNKICQFQTISKNIPYDYYLTISGQTLDVFKGKTLQIQPFYSQPITTKRVGLKDFTLVKCIGVGGFSRVYMVRKRDNGKFYALKLIDKKFILDNQKEIIVQNERDIMVRMENQFVTPLQYAFETKYYIAFVLDYCAGGELFYHLRKLKRLNEQDAKFYFVEICIGMAYLHSQHIVYRDIKPENILLDLQGHLLLSDFGLSKPDMTPDDFAYSFCGSPEYMAPEMLMKTGHNYLVDCYCLGALLYELVTGLPPFYSHNTQEIYNSILTETIEFPQYVQISPVLKDLILQLLQKDPTERLGQNGGVVEILTHKWFQDVDFEAIANKKLNTPYKPEPLKYNFDEEEFSKGDSEFRKQYQTNMQKEFQNVDTANYVLKNFYYSRESQVGLDKTIRIKEVNLNQIQNLAIPTQSSSPSKIQLQSKGEKHPQQVVASPQEGKRINRQAGKSEVYDYFKKHDLSSKQSQLLHQSTKLGHSYSKTMQQAQSSLQDLKQFKLFVDQSKALLCTDRTNTMPDQNLKNFTERLKTEQFGNLSSPKTITNSSLNKLTNFSKLFTSEKQKQ
ncbi:unnamed protein product (macronuclear) [Paramecium tetraurelia]|uniref:Protein kinase domain-containing protein n=1 Tax=Paramecium tetraurelia TaxID=5888 RepID=A0BUZ8_PARTE|nr:uncharacterized protein GSPATT00005611001 [Paramecium tetraurelia]CAK62365.1 unnamed protein product [Paramecium tetraurelia]|eukprot:XP_001429763.1 hypothetical protein (macronuclear) [Paramecium tetraurelia strain d4-2]